MKYYSIRKFSRLIGVTPQTLRNWDKKGKLPSHHTSSNGYRYYSEDQLNAVTGMIKKEKKVFGYLQERDDMLDYYEELMADA